MTLNFRAILFGLILDLAASMVGMLVVVTLFTSILLGQGYARSEIEVMIQNPGDIRGLLLSLMAVGVACDGIAGYATARRAGFLEYWHVVAMLGLLLIIQLASGAFASVSSSLHYLGWFAGIAAALAGAYHAKQQRLKRS